MRVSRAFPRGSFFPNRPGVPRRLLFCVHVVCVHCEEIVYVYCYRGDVFHQCPYCYKFIRFRSFRRRCMG